MAWFTWPILKLLSPYVFGTVKDRNFKFGTYTEHNKYWPLHDKLPPVVGVVKVMWPKFGTHLITYECMKLCIQNIVHCMTCFYLYQFQAHCPQMKNLPVRGRGFHRVTHFEIFDPSISSELLKIETSYLALILKTTNISYRMTNYPLRWAWSVSCDLN